MPQADEENLGSCWDCDDVMDMDDLYRNEYDHHLRCAGCDEEFVSAYEYELEQQESTLVHSYSYKPNASFLHDDGTSSYYVTMTEDNRSTLYLGMEEEVECTDGDIDEGAEFVLNTINDRGDESVVYLKEDGSINHGFEIVSHPATLGFYMNHFKWEGIKGLSRLGYESWNKRSCGLHIHMTRAAFKDDKHLFKFLKFVYGNPTELIKFAGRKSTYAKFDVDTFLNSWNDYGQRDSIRGSTFMKMAKRETINDDRYCAVNLRNVQTVELRFFRPSLKPETVQAALQFCDAAFHYTEQISTPQVMSGNALAFNSFRSWVATKPDTYKILDDRLTQRLGERQVCAY